MAGRVYLELKGKQSGKIDGESTVESIGGLDVKNMIECDEYTEMGKIAQDPSSRLPTGARIYDPIQIRKWIDKSSPLLANCMVKSEEVEGTFHFFRPSADNQQMEEFFTVKFTRGRISSLKRFLPTWDQSDVSGAGKPAMEEVAIVFGQITWEQKKAGTVASDDWRNQT